MSFHRYMSAYRQLSTLKEKKPAIEQRASTFSQLVTHFTVTLPDPEHNVTLQQLRQLQSTANEELTAVVIDMINQLYQQIRASKYDRNTILISTEYRDCRGREGIGREI